MLLKKVREGIDRNEGVLEDLYIYIYKSIYFYTLKKKKSCSKQSCYKVHEMLFENSRAKVPLEVVCGALE